MKIMSTPLDWIKEFYFESKYPGLLEFISFIVQFFTLVVLIDKVYSWLSKPFSTIVVGLLISIMIVFLWVSLRKIRDSRYELILRNSFIEHIATKLDPNYKILDFTEMHEIQSNQHGFFSRTVKLRYLDDDVGWYEMAMGSTNELRDNNRKPDLHVFAVDTQGDKKLAKILYRQDGNKKYYAILLDPILSEDNPEITLKIIRYNWYRIWSDFIEKKADKGKLTLHFGVDNLTIRIVAPPSYKIRHFDISLRGNIRYEMDPHGRHNVVFVSSNVKQGVYEYQIQGEKVVD